VVLILLLRAIMARSTAFGLLAAVTASLLAQSPRVRADPLPGQGVRCVEDTANECRPGGNKVLRFAVQFLNWVPDTSARGVRVYLNKGTSEGLTLRLAGIDRDGSSGWPGWPTVRVGEVGFDDRAAHDGVPQGALDILFSWTATNTATSAHFWSDDPSDLMPGLDPNTACTTGSDAFGESNPYLRALGIDAGRTSTNDGGPLPWVPSADTCGSGHPQAPSGNVREGFYFEIENFDTGKMVSLNWHLIDANGDAIRRVAAVGNLTLALAAPGQPPPQPPAPGNVFSNTLGFARNENYFEGTECGYGGPVLVWINPAVGQLIPPVVPTDREPDPYFDQFYCAGGGMPRTYPQPGPGTAAISYQICDAVWTDYRLQAAHETHDLAHAAGCAVAVAAGGGAGGRTEGAAAVVLLALAGGLALRGRPRPRPSRPR